MYMYVGAYECVMRSVSDVHEPISGLILTGFFIICYQMISRPKDKFTSHVKDINLMHFRLAYSFSLLISAYRKGDRVKRSIMRPI